MGKSLEAELLAKRLAERAVMEGAGALHRWQRDPTWRCANAHVSKAYQRGRRGRKICFFAYCDMPVQLTFPEDRSGPLS